MQTLEDRKVHSAGLRPPGGHVAYTVETILANSEAAKAYYQSEWGGYLGYLSRMKAADRLLGPSSLLCHLVFLFSQTGVHLHLCLFPANPDSAEASCQPVVLPVELLTETERLQCGL